MAENQSLKYFNSIALADVITCVEMPDDAELSDRTMATRRKGAYSMMVHLVTGEWDPSQKPVMQEFLGRVAANAARQGIEISVETHSSASTQTEDTSRNTGFDSQDYRDQQSAKTEERIRTVQDLRNSS